MQRHEFHAMGSRILALIDSDDPAPTLQDTPTWFEDWEQCLSRFRVDSELSQLNHAAGSARRVSRTLWEVYLTSVAADQLTLGFVNPLVLNSMINAGYDREFALIAGAASTGTPDVDHPRSVAMLPTGRPPDARSLAAGGECILEVPDGYGLDFGGVAKGWAADQAMRKLARYGPALISAGGDVAISGSLRSGEPWRISIDDPFRIGDSIQMIHLTGGGVATSGRDRRRWYQNGMEQHHVIDIRTGRPAQTDVLTATVVAPDVMRAEAMAKAVLISGGTDGLAWLNKQEGMVGMLVLESGEQLFSDGFENYLQS